MMTGIQTFNPFPYEKFLDRTKLKAFAEKLDVTKMIVPVFDKVENMVGKGEIACTGNFSFSHYVFKASFPDPSKGVIVWEWVKVGFANRKSLVRSRLGQFISDDWTQYRSKIRLHVLCSLNLPYTYLTGSRSAA